jgi:hypothetical protein
MKRLSKESLDFIKARLEKVVQNNSFCLRDYEDMRAEILSLTKENSLLKEKLFDLEQSLPEEQQWQNIIASKLELSFFENGCKEFLEINNSINNQTYTIIIQRKFGKTPKQLFDLSEIRRLKVIKKNIALQKHIKSLEVSCANYSKELAALKYIMGIFKSDDDVEVTRKLVEAAIANTKALVLTFNNSFIKYEGAKLHSSFKEAFREGFRRASEAENFNDKLIKEIKILKREILKKKYPRCRIYKGRLKRD